MNIKSCRNLTIQLTGSQKEISEVTAANEAYSVKTLDMMRAWVPKRVTAYLCKEGVKITHMRNGQNVFTGSREKLEKIAGDSGSRIYYVKTLDQYRVRLPKDYVFSL